MVIYDLMLLDIEGKVKQRIIVKLGELSLLEVISIKLALSGKLKELYRAMDYLGENKNKIEEKIMKLNFYGHDLFWIFLILCGIAIL